MKSLAAVLVLTLLTMRIGCFCDEVFVTPVQDSLFGVVFMATETDGEGKLPLYLKGTANQVWVVEPVVDGEVILIESTCRTKPQPGLLLRQFPAEVFIPPEAHGAPPIA